MKIRPEQVGEIIKSRRLALGLSQSELGRRLGVQQQTVSRWEAGHGDATALRMINFILAGTDDSIRDGWMRRALRAEGAIKDMAEVIQEYRGLELQNGRHGTDAATLVPRQRVRAMG